MGEVSGAADYEQGRACTFSSELSHSVLKIFPFGCEHWGLIAFRVEHVLLALNCHTQFCDPIEFSTL